MLPLTFIAFAAFMLPLRLAYAICFRRPLMLLLPRRRYAPCHVTDAATLLPAAFMIRHQRRYAYADATYCYLPPPPLRHYAAY